MEVTPPHPRTAKAEKTEQPSFEGWTYATEIGPFYLCSGSPTCLPTLNSCGARGEASKTGSHASVVKFRIVFFGIPKSRYRMKIGFVQEKGVSS